MALLRTFGVILSSAERARRSLHRRASRGTPNEALEVLAREGATSLARRVPAIHASTGGDVVRLTLLIAGTVDPGSRSPDSSPRAHGLNASIAGVEEAESG